MTILALMSRDTGGHMNALIKCNGVSVVLSIGHFELVEGTGRVSNLNQWVFDTTPRSC